MTAQIQILLFNSLHAYVAYRSTTFPKPTALGYLL